MSVTVVGWIERCYTAKRVSREQRTCFCEWGGAFLLIRDRRESYQQKQMLFGFVRVCMHILLLNV